MCQRPMLSQIKWEVQNGPITKNEGLPVTALNFENFVKNPLYRVI